MPQHLTLGLGFKSPSGHDLRQAVVAYDPTHPNGFGYVPRQPGYPRDIPIRRQTVKLPR